MELTVIVDIIGLIVLASISCAVIVLMAAGVYASVKGLLE